MIIIWEKFSGSKTYNLAKFVWDKPVKVLIKLKSDTTSIKYFEDESSLKYGDPLLKSGNPLSAEQGTGI